MSNSARLLNLLDKAVELFIKDYDALAADLAVVQTEFEKRGELWAKDRARLTEVLSEIDNHHAGYCNQMRGPDGEQWRDRSRECNCWVDDVMKLAK